MVLSGKVALVTGGSRGIGAAIVSRLAREGARVAYTYASSKPNPEDGVLAVQADSGDPEAVRAAVAQTVSHFGGIDILVNNAGALAIAPLDQFSLVDFDRLLAVNVRGVFVACQEASRHMQEGGRIITIGSCNAERIPFAGGAVYAMTKAAIVGLTKGLARDLGPRGITVNNVQPGPTDTDMNPASGPMAPSMLANMALSRYGTVEEVAALVAFLAGPEAGYLTGASLTIDGGYTC